MEAFIMCVETYQKLKKTREAIVEVCMALYRENIGSDDSLIDIEERMVSVLREYDDIVGDYVIREEE
jgi:uncharacterized protein YutD